MEPPTPLEFGSHPNRQRWILIVLTQSLRSRVESPQRIFTQISHQQLSLWSAKSTSGGRRPGGEAPVPHPWHIPGAGALLARGPFRQPFQRRDVGFMEQLQRACSVRLQKRELPRYRSQVETLSCLVLREGGGFLYRVCI